MVSSGWMVLWEPARASAPREDVREGLRLHARAGGRRGGGLAFQRDGRGAQQLGLAEALFERLHGPPRAHLGGRVGRLRRHLEAKWW